MPGCGAWNEQTHTASPNLRRLIDTESCELQQLASRQHLPGSKTVLPVLGTHKIHRNCWIRHREWKYVTCNGLLDTTDTNVLREESPRQYRTTIVYRLIMQPESPCVESRHVQSM